MAPPLAGLLDHTIQEGVQAKVSRHGLCIDDFITDDEGKITIPTLEASHCGYKENFSIAPSKCF